MDLKTILIVVLGASIVAWFTPTPIELQTRFKSGQDFYAAKDYVRAIEQYDAIIESESQLLKEDSVRVLLLNNELNVGVRTAAYYQKGNALRNMRQEDSAVALYRVVEGRADSPRLSALAQYQIYEIFYSNKEYTQAIAEARALVDRHPTSDKVPQAYYDIGWCFRELKMLDSSGTAFEDLVRLYPDHPLDPRARYQAAENYFEQGHWSHAIQEYNDLITKYRPESFAKSEWENVELKALRDRKLFEAVTGKDVDLTTLELTAKAQVRIGDAFRARGIYDSAMTNYRKVVTTFSLMPTLVEATIIKMAEYTTEHLGLEEGIRIYQENIDASFSNKPLQAKLQYKIAKTYQEQKLYAKAAGAYLFYAEAYPREAEGIKFPVEQARFLATSNYFNAREYVKTVLVADSMLVSYPSSELTGKILLYRGLSRSSQLRYADARRDYAAVISYAPHADEAVIARTQLGKTHLDERNYAAAVREFEALLASDSTKIDFSEVEYFLGLSYYGLGEHRSAIDHLERVETSSTYYAFTLARITRAYGAMRDFDGAEAFLDSATASAGKDSAAVIPFIRLARAELFTAQQKYPGALAEFDAVVNDSTLTENTRMQALYGRGLLHAEMSTHAKAVADLRRCLGSAVFSQVFPALVPAAKEKLAFALMSSGNRAEGEKILDALVQESSSEQERSRYLAGLAEFRFKAGEFASAVTTGNRVIVMTDPDQSSLLRSYASVANGYGNLQQPAKAIATMVQAADRVPDNAFLDDVFFQLAGLYFTAGDYGNAAEAYLEYLEKYPKGNSVEEATFLHGMCLYSIGQADKSIEELKSFIARFDTSDRVPEALLQIGEAYFNTNRFAEASAAYARVYKKFPKNDNAPLAMLNEGWSYFQAGEPSRMLEIFDLLSLRYPESPLAADASFSAGDYFYNNKSYDSALVAYQTFVDRFPDNPRSEEARQLIHELGQVGAYREYERAMEFFDAKNWDLAAEELKKVMEKYPNTDVVYGCKANVASALAQSGQRQTALKMFNEIIEQWQNIEAARPAVFFAELHKRWIESGR